MRYTNLIDGMTWSYSRLTCFEDCPYRFYLSYIKRMEKEPRFFSDYGQFLHSLLDRHLSGELRGDGLTGAYLTGFRSEISGKAPSSTVFYNYFHQGLDYLRNFRFPYRVLETEQRREFQAAGLPMVGVIDCVAMDGDDLVIVDHKSHSLKPRSGRKKPTKSDAELDRYLRQLYLYAIPVREKYGVFPARLEFNCFRTGQLVSEPFQADRLRATEDWAASMVSQIRECDRWRPDIEFFKCKYICDLTQHCDYFQTNFPPKRGGKH